jgi:hypothetical protein
VGKGVKREVTLGEENGKSSRQKKESDFRSPLPVARWSTPKKPGVLGADVTASSMSSDLALWFEASDNSDEFDKVRPGRAGRHRGERKGEGLKDRAKLAMVISFG